MHQKANAGHWQMAAHQVLRFPQNTAVAFVQVQVVVLRVAQVQVQLQVPHLRQRQELLAQGQEVMTT